MVVIYFMMQSLLEKQHGKNSSLREKTSRSPFYFVNSHNTHAYDLSTMAIVSVVRYFLLLNQLTTVGLGIFK